MIVKFFIFLMQSDGVLLQQKSTANTDGCIYSAYSEIFLILYVFVFFYFFFILLPVLDGMLYNVTMVFLFIFQITAGARCIFVLRNFEGIGSGVDDAVATVGGAAQGVDVETLFFFHLFNHVRRCTEKVFLGVAVGKDGDVGVYYLTAIVSLFGPVERVVSSVRNLAPKRVNVVLDSPEYGQEFDYSNESQAFTILEMKNGVTGTFCVNGDSTINDQAVFTIYGKKGILKLVDPNNFGGDIVYIPGVKDWTQQAVPEVLDYGFAYSENSRGLGPSEMAEAIAEGRLNRANAKMAYHVLDVIDQIMKSAKSGAFEKVPSTCERPAALPVPEKEQ